MALCVLSFGLVGCNQNGIDKEVEDALPAVTLVHVTRSNGGYARYITSIVCFDKYDNQTSIGYNFGDYQVPQEGRIVVAWYFPHYEENYVKSIKVGNAVEMTIRVGESDIYVE